jgi:hypothetical protein
MMLIPEIGGSTKLSVTGGVPLEVAVIGVSIDVLRPGWLVNIDQVLSDKEDLLNTTLQRSPGFSSN